MYIDTHCHLYLSDFEEDIGLVLQRAEQEDVAKFYLPAIDSVTHAKMLALATRFPGKCIPMMGLHPTSVKENHQEELHLVEQWLKKGKFAAVGEIGLDFYWDEHFKPEQIMSFKQQVDWALQYGLPVVIHSRNALDECIEIIRSKQTGALKGIFHCFSGTINQAKAVIDTGLYLGIGGVLTYKNSGLSQVISEISLDHVVLETDAPYLAPVPHRGKRNESSYLKYVIEKIATIKNTSPEKVGLITTSNAEKIFPL